MSLCAGRKAIRALVRTVAAFSISITATCLELDAGEFRSTVGPRTLVRAASFEPTPDEHLSSQGSPKPHAAIESGSSDIESFNDGACGDGACGDGACCDDPWLTDSYANNYWIRADYLLWWRKGQSLPPLVTTSGINSSITDAGVLGEPTTAILFGQEDVGTQGRPGGRLTFGTWCDACRIWSVEVDAFFLGKAQSNFERSNADVPILARPFFNVTDNQPAQQDSLVIAYPGTRTGSITVNTTSEILGGDVHLRRLICDDGRLRLDLHFGYQFSRIDESLTIQSQTDAADLAANLLVRDQFSTRNEFHGGSLGLLYSLDDGRWSWRMLAKVGLGNMHQSAQLSGQQIIDDGVTPLVSNTGLLVQSTNRGLFAQDKFAAVPELNLNGIYHVSPCIDLTVGYTFMLWSHVLQPGGTIDPDLAVNIAASPVTQRPINTMNDGNYWVHGLNFGIQWRF